MIQKRLTGSVLRLRGAQLGKRKLVSLFWCERRGPEACVKKARRIGTDRLVEASTVNSQSDNDSDKDVSDEGMDEILGWCSRAAAISVM